MDREKGGRNSGSPKLGTEDDPLKEQKGSKNNPQRAATVYGAPVLIYILWSM